MRNYLLALASLLFFQAQAQNFSLAFNGTNQYVNIPDQNSIDLSANFTIEAWVYPTGVGSQPTDGGIIINKENSYEMARFADGTIQYALSANGLGSDWTWISTGLVAPLNTWSNIVFIKSGTTVTFYLNGVLGYTNAGSPATLAANTQDFRIGARTNVTHNFDGRIEEVRVWNTVRTTAEIKGNLFNRNIANNAAGLLAHYEMNEGSGITAANSSTNTTGLDGTLVNTPAWTASPIEFATNALSFDGTNDAATIPDHASLDITAAITLEAWVYATKNTGIQNVISKSSAAQNNGYIFPRTDNGWTSVVIYFHIAGIWRVLSAPYPSLNTWHHLAATYNGTSIILYINGVQAAAVAQTGAITANSNPLALGNQTGFAEYFGGYADEFRIWNVARTQPEIQANMNKELDPALYPNLVSYYQANQGIAAGTNTGLTTVADQKNDNNATLSGFALTGATSNYVAQPLALGLLPVSWLSFTGQEQDHSILLNWSTAQEENTRDFTVEHSSNGSAWNSIGKLPAAGNSTTVQQYNFIHQTPASGINYYRILQTDLDGRSQYSKIITVTTTTAKRYVIVYPNPVTDGTLRIQLPVANTLFLYNSTGKLMMSRKLSAGAQQVNVSRLAKGIYQLKVGEEVKRVLIQ